MSLIKFLFCALILGAAPAAWGHADHSHDDDAPGFDVKAMIGGKPTYLGSASLALAEKRIDLFDGYGPAYFFVSPQSPEEEFVNQGFSSLNVFHYIDAFRSFRTASLERNDSIYAQVGMVFAAMESDPSQAGIYFSSLAFQQIQLISQQRQLSPKEDAWVQMAKAFYVSRTGTTAGLSGAVPSFAAAYQNLIQIDGQNPEVQGYINWSLLSGANIEQIKRAQQQILLSYPDHGGAHHYLTHIAEMQNDMDTARYHAEILTKLSPDSAHAQHMYGHTLPQAGQWQKALDMFLIADRIHHDWAAKNQVALEEDWHYAHNLDLMAATYLGLGDNQKAIDTWIQAMPFDYRAIPKAIGVAFVNGQLDIAAAILDTYEAYGPQWVNFLKPMRDEYKLLTNPTATHNLVARPGTYDYFVKSIVEFNGNPAVEAQLIAGARQFFAARLKSGGFDGWSNGFVELLRLKAVAKTFGAAKVEQALGEIEQAARTGNL